MATAVFSAPEVALVSVEEYLRTSYHPDCDFVEGVVEERNLGEFEHSRVQLTLSLIFGAHEKAWSVVTAPECRLQVSARRFRVPDVMVLRRGTRFQRIILEAPLVCIEVISPEDTWARMRARLNDYLAMGVEHLWCFDPEEREVWRYTGEGYFRVREAELTVPGTAIAVKLAEVFAVLDEDAVGEEA